MAEEEYGKYDTVCGNCGNPMFLEESHCPKCGYPTDVEEQRFWKRIELTQKEADALKAFLTELAHPMSSKEYMELLEEDPDRTTPELRLAFMKIGFLPQSRANYFKVVLKDKWKNKVK